MKEATKENKIFSRRRIFSLQWAAISMKQSLRKENITLVRLFYLHVKIKEKQERRGGDRQCVWLAPTPAVFSLYNQRYTSHRQSLPLPRIRSLAFSTQYRSSGPSRHVEYNYWLATVEEKGGRVHVALVVGCLVGVGWQLSRNAEDVS